MSRPERRRPGAQSPLLTPQVEAVRTAPAPSSEASTSVTKPSIGEQGATAVPPREARPVMIDRTFKIEEGLVRRIETAVLRRAGGYTSMRAFVSGAIATELARLEEAYNGGAEFPPNSNEFQRGRPFGS